MEKKPYLIKFKKLGKPKEGYLSVAEAEERVPFKMKRIFWTYYTPESVLRGRHAHHKTQLVLIATAGTIIVHNQTINGEVFEFELKDPSIGLYIPPKTWHTMRFSHNAVQLVIASTFYTESDYIRKYSQFKAMMK